MARTSTSPHALHTASYSWKTTFTRPNVRCGQQCRVRNQGSSVELVSELAAAAATMEQTHPDFRKLQGHALERHGTVLPRGLGSLAFINDLQRMDKLR